MSVNIKIDGLSVSENGRAFCSLTGNGIDVDLKNVHTYDNAEIFNNITDMEANNIVAALLAQQQCLNSTDPEYQILQNMRSDMQQSNYKIKDLLKKYMPNLITSTLANILGKHIL